METKFSPEGDLPNPTTLRPTSLDVDLDALAANFELLKARASGAKLMAVVKANAYGHGLTTCGRFFEHIGADYLGVAFVEEGMLLRQAGVKIPILVLGGIFDDQIHFFLEYNLDITASSLTKLRSIEQTAAALGRKARVHLKIDTGMERIGTHYYSAGPLLEEVIRCTHCEFVGAFTHLATSKDEDTTFAGEQLRRFLDCLSYLDGKPVHIGMRHAASSGAILQLPESHLELVRPGIALYGGFPGEHLIGRVPLQQAMTLRSRVVFFKVVKQGSGVSYGLTWKPETDTRVVTIPIGYGDGYPRRLSNRATVLVRGKRCRQVGMICMDQIMVDIGPDGEAHNGDEVVLLGRQGEEVISVQELADLAETTPYEIFVSLNLRLPRRYYSPSRGMCSAW